ncbi:Hypothetical predicted protein [Olea europaea subsp. europaea]|uniref:Uncharacterized protein n=1 Tax=Olea europaea subsp. europaea TaxID=158383 RepID=A0A8S0T253_OLEEU|nr:Hypothetical predicted protein [Olea europaea subsp. europaea]
MHCPSWRRKLRRSGKNLNFLSFCEGLGWWSLHELGSGEVVARGKDGQRIVDAVSLVTKDDASDFAFDFGSPVMMLAIQLEIQWFPFDVRSVFGCGSDDASGDS